MEMILVDMMRGRGRGCMSLMHKCRCRRCRRGRKRATSTPGSSGRALLLAPAGSWIDAAASKQFQFQFLVSVNT
jgi:hypothetical protein